MSDAVLLETDRLRLRRFADSDADAALLLDLDSDPEVLRYVGRFSPTTLEGHRDRIRLWLPWYGRPPQGVWAVEERATNEFLGWAFLRPAPEHRFAAAIGWADPAVMELGYRFRRAAWGRGYATEAAAELVRRGAADPAVAGIVAVALVTNRGSRRVLEKCGLRFEREVALDGFDDPGRVYSRYRDGAG